MKEGEKRHHDHLLEASSHSPKETHRSLGVPIVQSNCVRVAVVLAKRHNPVNSPEKSSFPFPSPAKRQKLAIQRQERKGLDQRIRRQNKNPKTRDGKPITLRSRR